MVLQTANLRSRCQYDWFLVRASFSIVENSHGGKRDKEISEVSFEKVLILFTMVPTSSL
jgi:hypothetical protein